MRLLLLFFLLLAFEQHIHSAPRKLRTDLHLSIKDQEFAQKLSRRMRKIFCGQFNQSQREKAIHYAIHEGKNPDEAVLHVMEETGMPLTARSRQETLSQR